MLTATGIVLASFLYVALLFAIAYYGDKRADAGRSIIANPYIYALSLAARDARVPWHAKLVAALTVAYALSPIDLVPDFIPVLGYLDDLLIVPLGIFAAVKLIPPELMAEHRATASRSGERPVSRIAMGVIIGLWVLCSAAAAWLVWRHLFN